MPKKIKKLVCKVNVDHKTKGRIQFVSHQPERPLLTYKSPPPLEDDEQSYQLPPVASEPEADPREVDPHRIADRIYQLMLSEARAQRLRGG